MSASRFVYSLSATLLGCGTDGTSPSLLIHTERKSIYSAERTVLHSVMVNCGEGVRRVANAHHAKLSTLRAVCFTQCTVQAIAGLPSVLFQLADLGTASVVLAGGGDVDKLAAAMKTVVKRRYPDVSARALCPVSVESACVSANGLRFPAFQSLEVGDPHTTVTAIPVSTPVGPVTSYIFQLSGGSTEAVLVIDCPTEACIDAMTGTLQFSAFLSSKSMTSAVIFHVSPPSVVHSALYQRWLSELTPTVDGPGSDSVKIRHVYVHRCIGDTSVPATLFVASAALQAQLHSAAPTYFPIQIPSSGDGVACMEVPAEPGLLSRTGSDAGCRAYDVAPPVHPHCPHCSRLVTDVSKVDGNKAAAANLRKLLFGKVEPTSPPVGVQPATAAVAECGLFASCVPTLLFLGTGCASPSPIRGCSGILLTTPTPSLPHRSLLLDCGEGCLSQLWRLTGSLLTQV